MLRRLTTIPVLVASLALFPVIDIGDLTDDITDLDETEDDVDGEPAPTTLAEEPTTTTIAEEPPPTTVAPTTVPSTTSPPAPTTTRPRPNLPPTGPRATTTTLPPSRPPTTPSAPGSSQPGSPSSGGGGSTDATTPSSGGSVSRVDIGSLFGSLLAPSTPSTGRRAPRSAEAPQTTAPEDGEGGASATETVPPETETTIADSGEPSPAQQRDGSDEQEIALRRFDGDDGNSGGFGYALTVTLFATLLITVAALVRHRINTRH